MWFSLMSIESNSPMRWLTPPPSADRRLLERAHARRGLARVEDPRAASARTARTHARGRGRHARQPAEEVQRRPLAGEQRARRALHAQRPGRASRHSPSGPSRSTRARVEPAEHRLGHVQPGDHPGAFWVIVARARASGVDGRLGGHVPAPTSSASARRSARVSGRPWGREPTASITGAAFAPAHVKSWHRRGNGQALAS